MNLQPLFTTARVMRAAYQIITTALLFAYLVKNGRRRRNRITYRDYRDED